MKSTEKYISFNYFILLLKVERIRRRTFFGFLFFKLRRTTKSDEFFIKLVLLIAVVALGSNVGFTIFHYSTIPTHWKVAITAFILLLPFCYFLQALLNVRSVKQERISKIQKRLREFYLSIRHHLPITPPSPNELYRNLFFRQIYQSYSSFIDDVKLYDYYQQAYNICTKKEQDYQSDETLRRANEESIKSAGSGKSFYDIQQKTADDIQTGGITEIFDSVVLERRKLLDFELDDSVVDEIVEQKMQTEGITFRSYFLSLSFFLFVYFAGFLITVPFINSIFIPNEGSTILNKIVIPLFNVNKYVIPFLAIQWGFLGGFVYTSISLLTRFLRKDLIPRFIFTRHLDYYYHPLLPF
jgi:hypothetical protein